MEQDGQTEKKRRFWQGIILDPGEQPSTVIRRHPIGVVAILLTGAASVVAVIVLVSLLMPDAFSRDNWASSTGGLFIFSGVVGFIVFIAVYIYRQSRILLTNMHLAQITQRSLVNRKISQLSLANVEDSHAEQRGILPTIFNYGTLTIQTAGEMENFIFTLCPNPTKYAEEILEAHQNYARELEGSGH